MTHCFLHPPRLLLQGG
jgi:hypothetical protein